MTDPLPHHSPRPSADRGAAAGGRPALQRYLVDVHDVYTYEVHAADAEEADRLAFAMHQDPAQGAANVECHVYVVEGPAPVTR